MLKRGPDCVVYPCVVPSGMFPFPSPLRGVPASQSKGTPMSASKRDITWHDHAIGRAERESLLGSRGVTVWMTGLPSSGKSTIADYASRMLHASGLYSIVLDGDNIRHGLNSDLGFSPEDRTENIRRIGEVAKLLTASGIINFVAFISPYRADRAAARAMQAEGDFIEVFVDVPVEVAETRDPKGLYKKARAGEIKQFTGISAPYEAPESPELHLDTVSEDAAACAGRIIELLGRKGITGTR